MTKKPTASVPGIPTEDTNLTDVDLTPQHFRASNVSSTVTPGKTNAWFDRTGGSPLKGSDLDNALSNNGFIEQGKRYISRVTNIDYNLITDEVVKTAVKNGILDIPEDWDWWTENDYSITLPGVNKTGVIEDQKLAKDNLASLNKLVKNSVNGTTTQVLGQTPNDTPK